LKDGNLIFRNLKNSGKCRENGNASPQKSLLRAHLKTPSCGRG